MNYRFLNNVLLRSPLYDYHQYSPAQITHVIKDPFFQVSLYLASPQLFEIAAAKEFNYEALNAREGLSLMRYYNRMSFRPTPFGSFSSFTMLPWGNSGLIDLVKKEQTKLHLNIDQEITLRLVRGLNKNEIFNNSYTCNPSLYRSGKDFRFVKTSYPDNRDKVFFDLESIESNKLTIALFNFCLGSYQKGEEIIEHMIKITGCDWEAASDYLRFLIEANIILPLTSPNIIGQDYLTRLLHHPEIPVTPLQQSLRNINEKLKTIDFPDCGDMSKITMGIQNILSDQGQATATQVFYSGLERNRISGNLPSEYQEQIMDGLTALNVLSLPAQSSALQQFIEDFKVRYDKQKVLLTQAVDPESGIGYGPLIASAGDTDLIRHVNFSEHQGDKVMLEWTAIHSLLLKRWNEKSERSYAIELTEEDISAIKRDQKSLPPPTIPVVFRVIDNQIYIESAGGASATALIGRFSLWSNAVHDLARQLAVKEQSANPDVIFADIGQISDSHADNINRRQHIYDYEITVNAISTLAVDHQIPLSDLWLSVVDNELVLESKMLKRVIVPRLTSAYNYNRNNLGVFRLLCDLQYQGLRGNYSFELENYFPGMAHYPRLVYKNTILAAAIWHLSKENLKKLKEASQQDAVVRLKELRAELNLPAVIALSKFDQQLVFNLDKEEEVVFLAGCLNSVDEAVLQEFFMPDKRIVSSGGQPLINQFIAFLVQDKMVYPGDLTPDTPAHKKMAQEYILGSKWLYLKLYCAPAIANDILIKKLLPVLKQLKQAELMSWFFIRYRDSGYHIRLRLRINKDATGHLLSRLKTKLSESVHFHLIREYQADTYRREMERYGPDIIELVEDFFYGSSELVLHYLKAAGNKSFRYTYHSLAFVSVAFLIDGFIPEAEDQLTFLEQMVNIFYAEFAMDKSLKIDLDQKFRELKAEIKGLLQDSGYYQLLKLTPWANLYENKITLLARATTLFSHKRKIQLLADLIHMHLNRLFVDRQRKQELIIYYCLYKHRVSVKAIKIKNRLEFSP